MTTGYVYCMTNESMHGVVKIGMTTRKMEVRLNEANKRDTFKIPTLFVVAIAKKVNDPKDKEQTLHKILTHLGRRVEQRREFFNASVEDVKLYFDLMDGELWQPKNDVVKQAKKSKKEVEYAESSEEDEVDSESDESSSCSTSSYKLIKRMPIVKADSESDESDSSSNIKKKITIKDKIVENTLLKTVRKRRVEINFEKVNSIHLKPKFKHLTSKSKIKELELNEFIGCRDLKKCLTNGQLIRCWIDEDSGYAIGIYMRKTNMIYDYYDDTNETCYSSLSDFVKSYYHAFDMKISNNTIWNKCECEIDGRWISMEWLPPFTHK